MLTQTAGQVRHSAPPTLQSIQTAGQVHVHSPQTAGCGTLKKHPACPWCWSTVGPSPRSWSEGCHPFRRCPAPGCSTGNERHNDGGVNSRSLAHKETEGREGGEREREKTDPRKGRGSNTHTYAYMCTRMHTHTHTHTHKHTHTHTHAHTHNI